MMENEENKETPQSTGGRPQPEIDPQQVVDPSIANEKRFSDGRIFGINFIIFAGYTVLFALTPGGIFYDGIILVFHLIACLILAGIYSRWSWALAGLAVFLVGVSTCAGAWTIFAH